MSDSGDISLTVQNREVVGKGLQHLRHDGLVPAVIHDHGKDSIHVQGSYLDMYRVYQQAGKHHPVHVTVGGKKYLALIRDANFEPRKNTLRHLVFNAIEQNKPVETEVPLIFEGDAEAEKAGLMVLRQLDNVEVKALPKDLPDQIVIDISGLAELGDKLHVSDLKAPDGVEILTEAEHPVAMVDEPRSLAAAQAEEDEAAAAAAAAEAAEGEEGEAGAPTDKAAGDKEADEEE